MNEQLLYKLDNPAWYSLAETHAHFSIGNNLAKRYKPQIVAFAAWEHSHPVVGNEMDHIFITGESLFIIGGLPSLPGNYSIESTLPCLQMVCAKEIKTQITTHIEKLGEADDDEIVDIINLVQPGYYKKGTRLMGDYFGIRQDGKLVAVTGERMCMYGLTEVSAVVTHPDFSGRKYAQQLVAYVCNKNLAAGTIPFLHVSEINARAISIYEYLGFSKRRVIDFSKVKRLE